MGLSEGERSDLTGHIQAQERAAATSAPAGATPSRAQFDEAYLSRTAPWVIGEPQPAIVILERSGWIRGRVLDPGCGRRAHNPPRPARL
jgi:hypothetical protein